MTIEYIRYTLKDHAPDVFLAAYAEASRSLAAAPECLGYEMTRCEEDENTFILRIHWASTQAHLEGFRRARTSRRSSPPSAPAEMRHYVETPLAWSRN